MQSRQKQKNLNDEEFMIPLFNNLELLYSIFLGDLLFFNIGKTNIAQHIY